MKDIYGDKITVETVGTKVGLTVNDQFLYMAQSAAYATLTPAKARKLARKLNRAADAIDAGGAQ